MKRKIGVGCCYYLLEVGLGYSVAKIIDISEDRVFVLVVSDDGVVSNEDFPLFCIDEFLNLTCSVSNIKQIRRKAMTALFQKIQTIKNF